jgi:phospholipase/carboxylesterase
VVLAARPAAGSAAARGPDRGPLVDAFLDAELERCRLAAHQLALVGFSQGARSAEEAISRPPVYLVHGDADEVVPVQAIHAAVAGLQAAGVPVQWSIRRGLPHGIDPDSVAHGAAFLAAAFALTSEPA